MGRTWTVWLAILFIQMTLKMSSIPKLLYTLSKCLCSLKLFLIMKVLLQKCQQQHWPVYLPWLLVQFDKNVRNTVYQCTHKWTKESELNVFAICHFWQLKLANVSKPLNKTAQLKADNSSQTTIWSIIDICFKANILYPLSKLKRLHFSFN